MLIRSIAASTVTAALLVSGCSAAPRYTSADVAKLPTATPAPSTAADVTTPTPTIGVTKTDWDDAGDPNQPAPVSVVTVDPTVSGDDQRTDAATRATEALGLFLRRDLTGAAREQALQAYLSPLALQDYATTDPTKIPGNTITGAPTVIPVSSSLIARIQIPTDAGHYVVNLSRTAENPQWRVERFILPERDRESY